ncbi:uncharacterized protein LOC121404945 [Drosophila obscura]|uniref:uncharacterized protein LOC121404945 n=1 Tax=Drosophila obscura TaxID=7282 RepID=UPI001BB11BE0|nr:uncharacterized protein LOC121404945 [Drosophila obscura]
MVKIADPKVDQLRFLLRERNLAVSGSRAELVQRLIEFEKTEDVEMPQATGNISQHEEETLTSHAAAISHMQNEMTELKNMMVQLVIMQRQNAEATASGETAQAAAATTNQQQIREEKIGYQLPQFIDRVNRVVEAYQWDEKFRLLAIYTRLKGPAKMWLDSSPVLHTTWSDFAAAIRDEFGSNPDEAEVHFNMANATRRSKETVKEYCFRMSVLGVRYKLSEAAVFSSMKQFRDAAESYFVNRGRPIANKKEFVPKGSNFETKQDYDVKPTKPKEAQKCYNCGELGHFASSCQQEKKKSRCTNCNKFHARNEKCQPADMMRLGAANLEKLFTRKIYIKSYIYSAFIDTGSQASIMRQSVAKQINADRHKCSMKIRGICGGSCILTEAMVVDMDIDGKMITAKVYVADDDLLKEDFLLGQDVIISGQLSLKFEPGDTEVKRAVHQPVAFVSNNLTTKLLVNLQKHQERSKMGGLLEKFNHVFSTGLQGIGKTNIFQANISVESGQVVSQVPYRVSEPKKEFVSSVVEELLEQDIIIPSTSEYASPVVLIKKPNGSDRLCVDYRRLNKLIKKENFPVPNIEERLQEAKRFKYFSSLNLNSGYYQIEVAPESRKFTAFITTDGLYEFKRLPFGLKTAPAVFNRLMAELQKRVQKGDMIHYMDDILIASQTFDEMYEKLERILQVLQECGLTLNLDKCELFKQTITFLGHQIHADGISPGEVKTNAIAMFSWPSNVTEVRQFLGLSDQTFKWEQPQQDAFDELKRRLISKPVVTSYRLDAEHELHTDASAVGLAGVLLQKDEMKPIAYYSRATSKAEKNYHSYELEALAVVESLERFKYYIYGKRIKVVTDCNALKTSMEKRELIPRIARWWLRIQEFDIDIVHRAGTQMNHVDALSRAPFEDAHEMDTASLQISKTIIDEADWLFAIQLQDEKIQKIVAEINIDKKSENDEYVIEQDRLFRKYDGKLLWLLYGYEPRDILKNTVTNAIQGPDLKMLTSWKSYEQMLRLQSTIIGLLRRNVTMLDIPSQRMNCWCELPPDEPDEDDDMEGDSPFESREDAAIFQERPTVKSC